jgi:UDP-N-acetylmuramate dehydrogenase
MNAGAYGREWRDVLLDAVIVDAEGERTLTPAELDLSYRHSALRPGEVVAQVRFRLEPRDPAEVKATVAKLLAQRKSTQPTNKRTFGSVFKNPPGERGADG